MCRYLWGVGVGQEPLTILNLRQDIADRLARTRAGLGKAGRNKGVCCLVPAIQADFHPAFAASPLPLTSSLGGQAAGADNAVTFRITHG